jgi:hypothetical protein
MNQVSGEMVALMATPGNVEHGAGGNWLDLLLILPERSLPKLVLAPFLVL